MAAPLWLSQLTWCPARPVAAVRATHVPSLPGVYMFTASPAAPTPRQVLYIGKAIDLRNRLEYEGEGTRKPRDYFAFGR